MVRQIDGKRKNERNEALKVYMFYHIIFILFNNIHFSPSPVVDLTHRVSQKNCSTFDEILNIKDNFTE